MAHESIVKIYANVPFDARYEHSIYWQAHQRQLQYFGHSVSDGVVADVIATLTDFSYLRKDNAVKVPIGYDSLANRGANYIAMYNGATGSAAGGWHYYFITSMEYLSDNCTRINVELDVLQTYQFMWDIPACFVEREHVPVSDDVPGNHMVDEGLDLGEIVAHQGKAGIEMDDLSIVVQTSLAFAPYTFTDPITGASKIVDEKEKVGFDFIDNLGSGFALYRFSNTHKGACVLSLIVSNLEESGKADAIVSVWAYPTILIDWEPQTYFDTILDVFESLLPEGVTAEIGEGECAKIRGTKLLSWEGLPGDNIGGYTPRNKKLLTYPYNFLYIYNNMGGGAIYKYELFSDDVPQFRIGGNLCNDGCVRIMPQNYRGYPSDNESGLTLAGYPTLGWAQDMYKIWMAQNASAQDLTIATGAISTGVGVVGAIASAFTMNPMGIAAGAATAYSGAQQIAGVMAKREDMQAQPPQAKGKQSSTSNITLGTQHFEMMQKGVTREFAERIDQYFDMYGYKVNKVKTPNITSRIMWNYIKTIGCVVLGAFPADDRRKIAAIFDKGVTFWKSPEVMYHYEYADANR